jgi:1-aminocyclopropane-1-carboxylate deaminase/D-cysteine desulfhydrase-like pyridoxal-dependent ACC family enzyme
LLHEIIENNQRIRIGFMLNEKEIIDIDLATIDELHLPEFAEKNLSVDVLRLDKIHPIISGNKWFKLKYYLRGAVQQKRSIITFGGAYSNHIIATAHAAKQLNLPSIGIIRGEESKQLSHTLILAKKYGMRLIFISRNEYLKKNNDDFISGLKITYPNSIIIPEGGAGIEGIHGSEEIMKLIKNNDYTHILCAVGTATTFLGLANASNFDQKIIGISALNGMNDLLTENKIFLKDPGKINNCSIIYVYHFGGYAKKNNELFDFMNLFFKKTKIPTDFVYTGKLFYAAFDLIRKNFFPEKSKLLIIHSGGSQGNDSLPTGTLNFN